MHLLIAEMLTIVPVVVYGFGSNLCPLKSRFTLYMLYILIRLLSDILLHHKTRVFCVPNPPFHLCSPVIHDRERAEHQKRPLYPHRSAHVHQQRDGLSEENKNTDTATQSPATPNHSLLWHSDILFFLSMRVTGCRADT